jgi:hypothetical protein
MLSLASPPPAVIIIGEQAAVTLTGEPGLADVVTFGRQQRAAQAALGDDEDRFFADTLAEYRICPLAGRQAGIEAVASSEDRRTIDNLAEGYLGISQAK